MDLTTLGHFAIAWVLVISAVGGWWAWTVRTRRSRKTPVEQLRSEMRAHRERLRKAATTEYGRRTDRR